MRAHERDRPDIAQARATWRADLAELDPGRRVFLDESGVDTRLTRTHARAALGQRAVGTVPGGRWRRPTVIGARGLEGVVASMSIADGTRRAPSTTAVFLAFVEQALIPAPRARPDAIVVPPRACCARPLQGSDEAPAGASWTIWARARPSGSAPPSRRPRSRTVTCRPTRPIEPCWSKLEGWLRAKAARRLEALDAELGPALATITARDAQGRFRPCGYVPPN